MWGWKLNKVCKPKASASILLFQLHYNTVESSSHIELWSNCETSFCGTFNILFLRLICVAHFSFIRSLSMLCFIPYCDYTIGYLFICLLVDVRMIPLLKLYPVLQCTFLYLSPGGHFVCFSGGINLVGELLNYEV